MKTAVEFLKEHRDDATIDAIEARDDEWRRLVEGAQGERDAARAVNVGLTAQRDRLNGELAEARRLLVVEIPTEHEMRCKTMHGTRDCWRCDVDAFLAATPAGQARPTYEDGECKPAMQLNVERLISATPIKPAEQAQGEAACASCGRPGPGCMESSQVTALAKRVDERLDEMDDRIAKLGGELFDHEVTCPCPPKTPPTPPPDYAHNHTFRQWEREGWPDRCGVRVRGGDDPICCQPEGWEGHITPAPPPPEAAGPGHAFVPCTDDGVKWRCFMCGMVATDPIHAVPPIAEGAAR
jgi:hypothetical protein